MKTKQHSNIRTTLAHCFGDNLNGWTSAAAFIRRAQVHDRKATGSRKWEDYPANRFAFFTDNARFLGVGTSPALSPRKGERLLSVMLPFHGSGHTLRAFARVASSSNSNMIAA